MNDTIFLTRGAFLRGIAAAGPLLFLAHPSQAQAQLTLDTIVRDPDAPITGNPEGDLTIVDFFDYNCPYCKASAVHLEKVVKSDGKIRLMYRDWPILLPSSMVGAKLALAAKYQGKYQSAHDAMMEIPGYDISADAMSNAVRKAGVEMERLQRDSNTHEADIDQFIKRNLAIADALGLRGTPGFLVDRYLVNQALDEQGFKKVIGDARAKMKR